MPSRKRRSKVSSEPSSSTRTTPPGTPTGASCAHTRDGTTRQAIIPRRRTQCPTVPPERSRPASDTPVVGKAGNFAVYVELCHPPGGGRFGAGAGQSDRGAHRLQRRSGAAGGGGAAHRRWPRGRRTVDAWSPTPRAACSEIEIDAPLRRRVDRLHRRRGARAPALARGTARAPRSRLRRRLPIGAGLSSSAALTVAAGQGPEPAGRKAALAGDSWSEVAFRAEYHQVGVRCGRMDQTIAAHGERRLRAALRDRERRDLRRVPFPGRLWIVETGVSHRLTGGALNQRRRECEEALAFCRDWRPGSSYLAQLSPADLPEMERRLPPPLVPRVRHVVTETARTRAAADALAARRSEPGWAGFWSRATSHCGSIISPPSRRRISSWRRRWSTGPTGPGLPGPAGAVRWWCWRRRSGRPGSWRRSVAISQERFGRHAGDLEHARVRRCPAGDDSRVRRYIPRLGPGGEMADARDLKSLGGKPRAGSSPAPGTVHSNDSAIDHWAS